MISDHERANIAAAIARANEIIADVHGVKPQAGRVCGAALVIHKIVHFDERGYAVCPFCKDDGLRAGYNSAGLLFYHCFACRAGGCAETVDGHTRPHSQGVIE